MWNNKNLPKFGPLSGVKVVHASLSQTGPFASQLLAEYGADVIWIENALGADITRLTGSWTAESDRKNQRNLALNIPTPEGKEILLSLLKEADIFIENSKAGQYARWGLTDEVLWGVNPKLVIAHVTGFGLTGLPEYVNRTAFDGVIQAFSGIIYANGNPVTAPYQAPWYPADMETALLTGMSVLAALNKAKETGVGESLDIAEYEVCMRVAHGMADCFTGDKLMPQAGDPNWMAGVGVYQCRDSKYILVFTLGAGVLKKIIPLIGLEYGLKDFPEGITVAMRDSDKGKILDQALQAYLDQRTASEAESEMLAAGVPCSKINNLRDLRDDPHLKARQSISEWKNFKGATVRAASIVPKFKNNPGIIWRAAAPHGMDNEEILEQLGYSNEKIKELYEKRVLTKDTEMKGTMPY